MKTSEWFKEAFESFEDSPDSQAEEAKLDVSDLLYFGMEKQGINQAEMARRLGCTRAYVNRLLQGDVNCTIETMAKIAHALGLKLQVSMVTEKTAPQAKRESLPKRRAQRRAQRAQV